MQYKRSRLSLHVCPHSPHDDRDDSYIDDDGKWTDHDHDDDIYQVRCSARG